MSSIVTHEVNAVSSGEPVACAAREGQVQVIINAKTTRRVLLCAVALLVTTGTAAGVISKYVSPGPEHKLTKLMNRFDINHDPSIPAWYSSCALLASSALLLLTGVARMQERDRFWKHWLALSAIFACLSLDEAAMFHEGINTALWSQTETEGVFYFPWVIPALIFVAVVGICYIPFLMHIDRRTAALFLAAGAVYVIGAVGMEMIAGPLAERYGEMSAPHMVCEVIEETLEMLGIAIFIYALLDHLARCVHPIRIQIVSKP